MTAEELLMSGEVFNYSNVINIDGETRAINFPIGEEFFGVEGDKDVERKFFSAPKIVGDNVDLSKHNIYINYVLADKDGNPKSEDIEKYLCDDVVVDENRIKFSWKLSERVLKEDGFVAFSVMAKKSENGVLKTVWYTTPGIGSVSKTIREGSDLSQVYPDVLDNLINRVLELENIVSNGVVKSVNGKNGEVRLSASDVGALPADTKIPSKTSELQNDNNLQNETQVISLINNAISNLTHWRFEVVSILPQTGDENIIYLVPNNKSGNNVYDEYIWLAGISNYEKIGSTDINLTGYATEAYVKDYAQPKGNYALKDDLKNLTTVQIITWESGD